MRVVRALSKVVWTTLGLLRNGAMLIVFVLMLGFVIASHTISTVADYTTRAIYAATGIETVTSTLPQRRATPEAVNRVAQREAQSSAAQAGADLNLDRAMINQLSAENTQLRQAREIADQSARRQIAQLAATAELDRAVISQLSNRTVALQAAERASRELAEAQAARIARLSAQRAATNSALTATVSRMSVRTRRVANANVAATTGEAIPFWGVAIIVAATGYELKSSCDTMHDLYEMQVLIDPSSAIPEDRDQVCGLQVPTKDEIWSAIKASPSAAWETTTSAASGTVDWAKDLEMPDFGGVTEWVVTLFD